MTLTSFTDVFPEIDTTSATATTHTSTIQGAAVGSYNLGCFVGAIATIWLGDILGRKKMIFLGSAIMVVGAIIQCSSYKLGQLVVGRLITGLGNGRLVHTQSERTTKRQTNNNSNRHEHFDSTNMAIGNF